MSEVRIATHSDIAAIAEIHAKSLSYSINVALGIPRLIEIYEQLLLRKAVTLLVVVDNSEVRGFICGSSDFRALTVSAQKTFSIRKALTAFRTLGILRFMAEVSEMVLYLARLKQMGNVYYMSNWAMLPTTTPAAGAKIFRSLLRVAQDESSERILVSVEIRNQSLINFYHKMGFKEVAKTRRTLFLVKTC